MRWIAALIIASSLAYFPVTGAIMTRETLGMIGASPESRAGWSGVAGTDPLILGYRGDPDQAFGLAYRTLPVQTPAGPAEAWLVAGAADAPFAAIYVHGIGGAREDGYRHLSMLAEAGIPTLLISYRNDPEAPAAHEGLHAFGLIEWPDLAAASDALEGLGHPRQVIVAESMGGAILGQFLRHSPTGDRIVAIALDAPVIDFKGVLSFFAAQYPLVFKAQIARVALFMLSRRTGLDFGSTDVTPEIAGFPGPLFIAHGRRDSLVPNSQTLDMLTQRQGVTILLETDGEHLMSWHAATEDYRRGFARFLSLAAEVAARP